MRRTPPAFARRAAGAGAGLLVDRWLGEMPIDPHPVAAFGTAMSAVEQRLWADRRGRGAVYTGVGAALGLAVGGATRSTSFATYVSVAGRMLCDTATEIAEFVDAGDLESARDRLPSLVGRDPRQLDEKEIVRAVVESVAENTADAIVAPAFWAAVAGSPGVFVHRAVNTMDAMVGHRSDRYRRFGWTSARADDVANWLPARLTVGLVMSAHPSRALDVVRIVRRDGAAHPSPNAGVVEAAYAAALGVRLGGCNRYGERVEDRATLGEGPPPTASDIGRAVHLTQRVTHLLAALLVGGAAALALRAEGPTR